MTGYADVLDVAAPPTVVFDASSVGAMPARSVHPTLNINRPTPITHNVDFIVIIVIVFLLAVTELASLLRALLDGRETNPRKARHY